MMCRRSVCESAASPHTCWKSTRMSLNSSWVSVRSSQPDGDLLAPFRDPLAPDRVGGHDVSQAERESDGVEQLREAHGKRHEIRIDTRVRGVVVIGQDEPVVLVGRQQAFAAAGGTHDDERERYRRLAPAVRCQPLIASTSARRCNSKLISVSSACTSAMGMPSCIVSLARPASHCLTRFRPSRLSSCMSWSIRRLEPAG